jgi:hypothetical protein
MYCAVKRAQEYKTLSQVVVHKTKENCFLLMEGTVFSLSRLTKCCSRLTQEHYRLYKNPKILRITERKFTQLKPSLYHQKKIQQVIVPSDLKSRPERTENLFVSVVLYNLPFQSQPLCTRAHGAVRKASGVD